MLGVLGEAALRTLLLAAAVGGGLRLLRIRRSQLLLVAWTVVLGTSLCMPLLARFTLLSVPIIPVLPTMLVDETGDAFASTAMQVLSSEGALDEQPQRWLCWLFEAVYVVVAATIASRVLLGVALSLRLVAKSVPVHAEWTAGMHVRISREVATPVTVAHTVLLPLDAENWLAETRQAVLAHERAHVLRWDYAMLILAQLNLALFWLNPLSWWLHRRLVVLAELASDDQAVAATGDGIGYAEILLEMGRRSGPLIRGVAMARPATLQYRIERVLSEQVSRAAPSLVQRAIFTAVVAGLAITAATSRTIPSLSLDSSLPQALETAEPTQPASSIDPMPSLSEQKTPRPSFSASTSVALQVIPEPSSVEAPTSTPNSPAVSEAPRIGVRETAKRTPSLLPMRLAVQPTKAVRSPSATAVQSGSKLVATAELVQRRNVEPGIAAGVGATRREAQGSLSPPARAPGTEPSVPRSGDEPSCTGVYLTKPGSPGLDGQADLVQVNYFQAANGTPWLKLLFGSRTQTRLNGFTVERTSVRATVVAAAPKDARRISGSSRGVFGSIDYECLRPNAQL